MGKTSAHAESASKSVGTLTMPAGRPPRTRSRPADERPLVEGDGKTSAHAESACFQNSFGRTVTEDLRARGVGEQDVLDNARERGRPPRTRSRLRQRDPRHSENRKTSAHAESMAEPGASSPHSREDLRARGVDEASTGPRTYGNGRPPRTRSRHWGLTDNSLGNRKTSAHAESTRRTGGWGCRLTEDLRARGVDGAVLGDLAGLGGRPPRTRSRHHARARHREGRGKTSAHAESTLAGRHAYPGTQEDLRARGVDLDFEEFGVGDPGRPPRTRSRP
ncbi:putative periplasmic protein kinase ArgK and related GTPases of G3E family [Gulosibacter sp. 10]|nr:putative periplasmic protein kinase ArgK and related GTPases of G3E family [Gulosibacter sp. 10]